MKKRILSIITTLGVVMSLVSATSLTASAATRKSISSTRALYNMKAGYEYYLTTDIDFGEDYDDGEQSTNELIRFTGDVTLDLNGHTITYNAPYPFNDVSDMGEGCSTFTVEDSSAGGEGKLLLTYDGAEQLILNCKLNVISGTVECTGNDGCYIEDCFCVSGSGKVSADAIYSSSQVNTEKDEVTGGTITTVNGWQSYASEGIILTGGEITTETGICGLSTDNDVTVGGSVSIPQGIYIDPGELTVQSDLENTIPIELSNQEFTTKKAITKYANMPADLQAKIVARDTDKFGILYDSDTLYLSRKYTLIGSVSGLPDDLSSQGGVTFTVDGSEVTTALSGQSVTATAKSVPGYTATLDSTSPITISSSNVTVTATYESSSEPAVTPSFVDITPDSGYYADKADGASKEGIIAFTSQFNDFASYDLTKITKFGMMVYNTDDNKIDISSNSIDELSSASAAFYYFVTDIASSNFDVNMYALPYVVYDGATYYGSILSSKVNAAKWLGDKATYSPVN